MDNHLTHFNRVEIETTMYPLLPRLKHFNKGSQQKP